MQNTNKICTQIEFEYLLEILSSGGYGTYISNSATTSIRANLSFIKNEPTDADAEESSQNSSFAVGDLESIFED